MIADASYSGPSQRAFDAMFETSEIRDPKRRSSNLVGDHPEIARTGAGALDDDLARWSRRRSLGAMDGQMSGPQDTSSGRRTA